MSLQSSFIPNNDKDTALIAPLYQQAFQTTQEWMQRCFRHLVVAASTNTIGNESVVIMFLKHLESQYWIPSNNNNGNCGLSERLPMEVTIELAKLINVMVLQDGNWQQGESNLH